MKAVTEEEARRLAAEFAGVDDPRRRAAMMAWLLRENLGSLERLREELRLQQAESGRLRRDLAQADTDRAALAEDLLRSRALADRGLAAAGLAHDFNNLLQAVLGHATVALGERHEGDPAREALERVVAAAKHAADLTRGLSRGLPGDAPAARTVDVGAIAGEVLDLLACAAPRHVELRRGFAAALPRALADPTDVRRIVLNLVMNAWQAIGARPGSVLVATGLAAGHGEEHVYVEVVDDGPGIDDDVRARLFEPFYTTREGGSGVGLPNVRRLVERWGGRIEVWSSPGHGARFRASLPAEPEPDEAGPGAQAAGS